MTKQIYTRLQLATFQLESAIGLYITGRNRFAVITLAGAADTILATILLKAEKETFTDHLLKIDRHELGEDVTREKYGSAINDLLGINDLKHLDPNDDGILEIDPDECALGAILKAMPNYLKVEGHDKKLFLAFRLWVSENLDPKKYNVNFDPEWERPSKEL